MDDETPFQIIRDEIAGMFCETDTPSDTAHAILSALSSKGLAVVPVEPTDDMIRAGVFALFNDKSASGCYRSMLAAAPKEGPDAILKAALKSESELMPNPRFARPKEGQGA